jgi:hypothetical protein
MPKQQMRMMTSSVYETPPGWKSCAVVALLDAPIVHTKKKARPESRTGLVGIEEN